MRLNIGEATVTLIGPDGLPLNRVGTFDFSSCRGRGNPWRREIQREKRADRARRKKRRGWA